MFSRKDIFYPFTHSFDANIISSNGSSYFKLFKRTKDHFMVDGRDLDWQKSHTSMVGHQASHS